MTMNRYAELLDKINQVYMADWTNSQTNYPPYNIVDLDNDNMVIEIALAGVNKEDLNVEVQDGILTVEYKPSKDERKFVHKGISTRSFKRVFQLHDFVEVEKVQLVNGLLSVHLVKQIPEEQKPRKFEIK